MYGRQGGDGEAHGLARRSARGHVVAALLVAVLAGCDGSITGAPGSGFSSNGGQNGGAPVGGPAPDGGVPPPPPDAGPPDPLDAAPTCSSGSSWTRGTHGSSEMEPGHACITCHAQQNGPPFNVGGTVYPTGHEPDDCSGSAAGGAVVTVTDRNGATASFTVSGVSGNFHGPASLVFPITAKVTFQGRTRSMTTAVPTGDCNSCHTQTGASSAPGRITLPP